MQGGLIAVVLALNILSGLTAAQSCSQLTKSSATISNSLAYVNVSWSEANGLTWQITSTGVFANAPSNFGDVKSNFSPIDWAAPLSWICIPGDRNSTVLTITQSGVAVSGELLTIQRRVQMYQNQPFARFSSVINSSSPIPVNYGSIADIDIPQSMETSGVEVLHIHQWSSVYDYIHFQQHISGIFPGRVPMEFQMGSFPSSATFTTNAAWFAIANYASGGSDGTNGLVVGIEFNGKSTFHGVNDGISGLANFLVDINALNHTISNDFWLPGFFIGTYAGSWDDAAWATHQFAEQAIHPPLPDDNYPYAQYDSWWYSENINATNQMLALEVSHAIGLEVFVLDLGWATQIGEWIVDPVKFPDGLQPLVDQAHAWGMKFGLHLPIAQAMSSAPILQQNPDYVTCVTNDYFGANPLCLGNQPTTDAVLAEIINMIDLYNIDYIVQDGEDMVKVCSKSSHSHNIGDSNYANSVEGIDKVIAGIRAHKPNIVLEMCADGGTMLTYRMASLYDTSISVDDTDEYTTRQGIFGMSYPFSPRYSARYLQDSLQDTYNFRSVMFGGPLIVQLQVGLYNDTDIEIAKANIDIYKSYRKMIRSGKVHHLIAPASLSGDGMNPFNGIGWDAIQSVIEPSKNQSLVLVFRANYGPDSIMLKPKGLKSSGTYKVLLHDAGSSFVMTGAALQSTGFNVSLNVFSSELIDMFLQDE